MFFQKPRIFRLDENWEWPDICVIIPAYQEADILAEKVQNTLSLDYPGNKKIVVITDGSTDQSEAILHSFLMVKHLHQPDRKGKLAALDRAVRLADAPLIVGTDANALLTKESLVNMIAHFADPRVGGVAGEKQILSPGADAAAGSGEGLYWRYENLLKRWDSETGTVVGAAGELFAFRKDLYEFLPADTIIEDFVQSVSLVGKGYRVVFEPKAVATEYASASVREELKRKIRIAAGGIQASWRLRYLLNPFRYGWFSIQLFSHRVMRWTLAPLSLVVVFLSNMWLVWQEKHFAFDILLVLQLTFYLLAILGALTAKRKIRWKFLYAPYYFCVMNYAAMAGWIRYALGTQSAVWEKARRHTPHP
ncbi:MAG: glycosyltransferase family 2 protein [Bacteroidota bacterium]